MFEKSLIRKLKIDIICGKYDHVIEWFELLWNSLYMIETVGYTDKGKEIIFYQEKNNDGVIEKKWIFYLDTDLFDFWCDHGLYWEVLSDTFDMEQEIIIPFTHIMMDNKSYKNLPPLSSKKTFINYEGFVEIALKNDNTNNRLKTR